MTADRDTPRLSNIVRNDLSRKVVQLRAWNSEASIQTLTNIHFAISSFAAIVIFFIVRFAFKNQYAANLGNKALDSTKYFEWLRPYFFPDHKYTIYSYVGACALLGVLALISLLVQTRGISETLINRRWFPRIFLVDLVAVGGLIAISTKHMATSPGIALAICVIWVVIVAAPFSPCLARVEIPKWINFTSLSKILMTVFAVEFLIIIFPCLSGNALFYNEYFDIPSETLIRTTGQDGSKLVDNLNYINANKLWGNQLRYDPRINPGEDPPCLPGARLDLPQTEDLKAFVEENKNRYYFRYPSGELCFIGPMLQGDWQTLRKCFPHQLPQIDNVNLQSQEIYANWEQGSFTPEQDSFVHNNLTEFIQTIHGLEAIFHHHFQFLNPIKELSENRPTNEIVALYGNNFIPITSIMQWSGSVTYPLFLTIIFSTYIIYLASVLAVTSYIFRDVRYVAIIFLSSLGLVKALGYITIFVGLGYSPLRHFLDIFVVLALFQYLTAKKPLWLVGAIALALLSVFLDRSFGSFVFVALAALLVVRLICGHSHSKRVELAAIIFSVPVFIALFVVSGKMVADSPYTDGFLDGVWGFPVSNSQVGLFLVGFFLAYLLLIRLLSRHFDHRYYLALFLIIYAQLLSVYWLVVPNYGHLYAVLPIPIMAGMMLLRFGIAPLISVKLERKVVAVVLAGAVIVSTWGTHNYIESRNTIESVERTHHIYNWNFSNMRIRSTMSPEPFADSVRLIEKYAPQSKGIYIVSQYDTVLTWLGERYSLMPLFDLGSFLNSPTSERKTIERLTVDQPAILFVDTCIKCSPEIIRPGRMLPGLAPAYIDRTKEKIDRLRHLRDVFSAVENDYELAEQGMLISVYRHK